jgi:hypothetical protein
MMANQYTGKRDATPLERAELRIERLESEAGLMQQQQDELLSMLKSVHDEFQSPDVARLLIIHGVDLNGAVYTTPRQMDKLRSELAAVKEERDMMRTILDSFAEVAPGNDYYELPNGMTTGQFRAFYRAALGETK